MAWIDRLNHFSARAVSWLVPLLVLELVYETLMRYLFNAPTAWSFDLSYMLYGALFMLGAGHVLQKDRHVRIETLYAKASPRVRALLDALGYVVFFFPAMGALVYYGAHFALKSWAMGEVSPESMWQPPIYPFKTLLPLAALLILLSGLARFTACLKELFGADR